MASTSEVPGKRQMMPAIAGANNAVYSEDGTSSTASADWIASEAADYTDDVLAGSPDLAADGSAAPGLAEIPEAEALANDDVVGSGGETGVAAEEAESFIASKRIGDRIKHLRQRKGMGLVELGRYTGLSASFLSQLETGRVVPTLRNLARLAMVFSKDLSYFFEPERPELFRILRAEERARLPQTGAEEPGYFFESLGHVPMDHAVTPYFAEFLPGNGKRTPRSHQHAGAEFLYVLSGQLQITHGSVSTAVDEGDAVYFNAAAPHSYERTGDTLCTALILTMPEPLPGTHTGAKIPLLPQTKSPTPVPRHSPEPSQV